MHLFAITFRPALQAAFRTGIVRAVILAVAVSVAACGTIIHPERQNQRATGNLDVAIVVLDGLGLLLFIIPGVIAYAVDFSNHTIYLPYGHRSHLDGQQFAKIHVDGKMDQAAIERAIQAETGISVDMSRPDVQVIKLESPSDMEARFEEYQAGTRVALAP